MSKTLSLSILVGVSTFSWFFAGCIPEFDDDLSRVESRRILAVRTVPAEVEPGADFELEALVADPGAGGAGSVRWALCVARKKLTELGPVAEACLDDFGRESEALLPLAEGETTTGRIPQNACSLIGPVAFADASGVSARPIDPDPTGGYYLSVLAEDEDVALGQVRVSCGAVGLAPDELTKFNAGYRPNENPDLERIVAEVGDDSFVLGAEPLRVRAGTRVELRAEFVRCPREAECGDGYCSAGENQVSCAEDCRTEPRGCPGAETYLVADASTRAVATRREGLSLAWFASGGRFAEEQTGQAESDPDGTSTSNVWTAPRDSGSVRLWFVLRDDRGGATFVAHDVEVVD